MKQKSRSSCVALMLVALLLANSSFALEILAHDSHAHDSHVPMMEMSMMPEAEDVAESSADDDCLCDEICCVSSVNLGGAENGAQALESLALKTRRVDHYQSVFLDPYLEPPTT